MATFRISDLPVALDAIEIVAQAMAEADGVRPWKLDDEASRASMEGYRRQAKQHVFAWRALWQIVHEGRRP